MRSAGGFLAGRRTRRQRVVPGGLLGRITSVDDKLRASQEGRLVRGKIEHPIGNVLWVSDPAQCTPFQCLLKPSRDRCEHGRPGGSWMDRVAPYVVFGVEHRGHLAKEAERCFADCISGRAFRAGTMPAVEEMLMMDLLRPSASREWRAWCQRTPP